MGEQGGKAGSGQPADLSSMRVPPHSREAEQSLLGGLMLDEASWESVADQVTEEDFYFSAHRLIFRALAHLAETIQPRDVVTVSEWLQREGNLEGVGGLAYLGMLARDTPSAANVAAYAAIVRARSVLRQLIRIGTDIAQSGYEPQGREVPELIDAAERQVFQIAEAGLRHKQGFVPIRRLLSEALDKIDTLFQSDNPITGLGTGLVDFDDKTAGLQPGDLVIIAGRPSMGKTSFAMNLAEHAAIRDKVPTAIFSMEMPGQQLAMRMISSLGRIDQSRVRTGRLADTDWPRITSAATLIAEAPMFIDDSPALSPTEIRARARRLKREHGLGLIVVDYLQLMQIPGNQENRASEIAEISRSLKALAKELNVPVIALSQLNRNLEQRPNKRPVMSDLRESGGIEQDADLIIFIYRDEVYNPESPDKGSAEIIIAKQRNGPTGTVRLTFLGQYTRFENFASEEYGGGYA
ncbi:replicative DNA helicase [Candidatus Macondimonas diazotrophica]|jgi:replicative DNA helicase|uniref:Replicative DNA helicase n=1 Tax=Candidatus Macondimonas diazotrophica TaxID=2305248 RepID=A0A4Z0FCB7_9GAMM|nr:replicative DNA helicase [Candidatus Macondimonas diazotrophica]NCU01750.1 replicative DNA helicase [Candidatus Macondimonas diazotrophica]TFZ83372.1 replicative DNA helicase [Candidatus Macondimonas diazotrophica]HBG50737.1 replicative DNA helicase [Gammaproteobacteria bacterium]